MKTEKLDQPTMGALLAEYSKKDIREVYQFEAIPEIDYGQTFWSAPLIAFQNLYILEKGIPGVRVHISRDVPKDFVVRSLKDIVEMLQQCDSPGAHIPKSIAGWFSQ